MAAVWKIDQGGNGHFRDEKSGVRRVLIILATSDKEYSKKLVLDLARKGRKGECVKHWNPQALGTNHRGIE